MNSPDWLPGGDSFKKQAMQVITGPGGGVARSSAIWQTPTCLIQRTNISSKAVGESCQNCDPPIQFRLHGAGNDMSFTMLRNPTTCGRYILLSRPAQQRYVDCGLSALVSGR